MQDITSGIEYYSVSDENAKNVSTDTPTSEIVFGKLSALI
jgi:hypothetical protein